MRVIIREAMVVDPRSPYNGQVVDIFVEDGKIAKIGKGLQLREAETAVETAAKTAPEITEIKIEGLHVSPGWVDIFVQFHDPGGERKETLKTGTDAAAAGGFTEVLAVPNTDPAVQNKGQVEYIAKSSKDLKARVHPIGAVSRNIEGKELAEMYDMHASGAKAFGDGWKPLQSAGLLLKALQYVKGIDGTVIQVPDDTTIGTHGLMHEGIVSTRMGLPGKSVLAEEVMVDRDLKLLEYTQSSIHFTGVTSEKSIEAIHAQKNATCSVTPHHLYFCDEDLEGYDTNLKVNPPLRDRKTMMALRQAVIDGKIDIITSHHLPQDWDHKICEFEYAKNGAIGLESAFGVVWSLLEGDISLGRWVEMASIKPREVFHLEKAELKEHAPANLTLFVPGETYEFKESDIKSKSRNSPFTGKQLKGRVKGTILHDQLNLL